MEINHQENSMQALSSTQEMWQAYLHSINETPSSTEKTFTAWHFCDNENDANKLAALVKAGGKSATASAYWEYEHDQEPIPTVGDYSIIINWEGEAQCIIRTIRVEIVPFNEVTAEFARSEGEGDLSLDYWRKVHWEYFARYSQSINRQPEETMPVVCETFEVVYGLLRHNRRL
jgi:uncharacterized protein YhfF